MAEIVQIAALGRAGDGIAETATGPVYVPLTLPGEAIEFERSGERGRARRIVTASPDRVDALCRHFGTCGGCALQHMARPAYLTWKRQIVADCLGRRGIEDNVEPVVPIDVQTRRRAVFSAIKTANGVILGFHRRGAGQIVPIGECPVLVPAIVGKLGRLTEIAASVLRPGMPARIVVLAADNGLDIAVDNAGKLGRPELERLGTLAGDEDLARLTVDGTQIFLNRQPEVRAGGLSLLPVPGGFVQAAAAAEAALAAAVLDHVGGATPVADLFAGIGTFALRLARSAAVTAVEGSAELLGAIGSASNATPGLKAVTLRKRDLFRNPLAAPELNEFGAVVFDPPAAGARAQAEAIAASQVPKVVAVSCNPATLARDARILIDGGYRPVRIVPVDQFLFSAEIEVVATFEK
jgi:23S rRNA (uracil1939-C5)-methyltransferase